MSISYDVLVLGSGPAGYYSALSCARGGFSTAIVNADGINCETWFVGDNVEVYGSSSALIQKNKTTIIDLRRDLYIHPTDFKSVFEAGNL